MYVIVRRKSLGIAVLFLDQASAVLTHTRLLTHVPGLTFVPLAVIYTWGAGVTVYLSAYASDRMADFEWHMVYRGWCLFHVCMMVWLTIFIILVVRCVVSCHVCAWYWAREPREPKLASVTLRWSIKRVFRYHSWSLALLALYMPLYAPLRLVRLFLDALLAADPSPHSLTLSYRPGAVCQIALHGYHVRRAALAAHQLKLRNSNVVGACLGASGAALAGGAVCVVGVVFCAVGFALHVVTPDDIHLAVVPAVAAAAAAAVTAAVFFTAYAEAIEAILQCFCEDLERNDGSAVREYYMPEALRHLVLERIRKPPDHREADRAFVKQVAEERRERREERRDRREAKARAEGAEKDPFDRHYSLLSAKGGRNTWSSWVPALSLPNPFRRGT